MRSLGSIRNGRGLLVLALALAAPLAGAADWPGWRGPNQDGTSVGNGVFGEEPFGLEKVWSRSLGLGYSGISVAGDRVVTMYADGESDFVVAFDAPSGDELWRYKIDAMFPSKGGSEGGPNGVPVIDDGVVYGLGAAGHLFALRLRDGSEVWSVRIDEEWGAKPAFFGFSTTPIVEGNTLLVQLGGPDGRSLAGLDKRTGKLLWSAGDDAVGYQSPVVATLAGRRQIVAVGNESVVGVAPDSGEILWSRDHGTSERDGSATPVLIGDDRFLVSGREESAAFRVKKSAFGFEVEEVWRSTALKGSFAAPVFYDGYVYGFDADFLTCIDPADGTKIWKSRPPGGQGLILVDGHLVVFAPKGEIVVAEASPEGYREKARLGVSETGSYTWPSFADGRIFVRNVKDIASVQVVPAVRTTRTTERKEPTNAFERFLREVDSSEQKRLLIDEFMTSQKSFPIVEGDLVHFVYRGDAEDVAISGTMAEFRVEEGMRRLAGTDLYHRTYRVEPGTRLEYRFNVDFENPGPDPLNPRRVPSEQGDLSEVRLPGWEAPSYTRPYSGGRRGTIERFRHDSQALGNEREIAVYLPPGYADGNRRYPVLTVVDGMPWIERAHLPNSLDHLIGKRVSPLIVVFVEQPRRTAQQELQGDKAADYVRMLADELVPYIDDKYRTAPGAENRAVMGATTGAMMAAYASLERPDVFGKVAAQSVYLPDPLGQQVKAKLAEAEAGPEFWVGWNLYEIRRADWGVDLAADSRGLHEALRDRGFTVAGGRAQDSSGWGGWRARVHEYLQEFFPAE